MMPRACLCWHGDLGILCGVDLIFASTRRVVVGLLVVGCNNAIDGPTNHEAKASTSGDAIVDCAAFDIEVQPGRA